MVQFTVYKIRRNMICQTQYCNLKMKKSMQLLSRKSHLPVNPLVSIKDMMMIGFLRSFWVEEVVSREAVLLPSAMPTRLPCWS